MGIVKIVCISDTHLCHEKYHVQIPDGDILIHSGDATYEGTPREIESFANWFGSLPHKHKIFVAGNHDWGFQRRPDESRAQLPQSVTYLQDSAVTVMGLRIYGSPWQPEFMEWAFNLRRGDQLLAKWKNIPAGVDVLVTHGPPMGVLDMTWDGEHVGCRDMMNEILSRVRPRLHVFGHVHHDGGKQMKLPGGTHFVNAALLDEAYTPRYKPVVVELDTPDVYHSPRGDDHEESQKGGP